jgi:hypothetical protein
MIEDRLPLTILVPGTGAEPVVIYDQHAALQAAVVGRSSASRLGDEWDVPGVYILLGQPDEAGRFHAYVGKSPAGMRTRVTQHSRTKENWSRALLVRRDTTIGLNSAQIGWLEGRLFDLLDSAELAQLSNRTRPGDETLQPYELQMLEATVLPVSRILRLLGFEPQPADDTPATNGRTNTYFGIGLAELVKAGALTPGRLTSTNGAWPASAELTTSGTIRYDGQEYASPSTAASAVKGGGSANGWEFWASVTASGNVPLGVARSRHLASLSAS